MIAKSYIRRGFTTEGLAQVMGIPEEKVILLTAEKTLVADASGKYSLPEANKAYLKYKMQQYREQVFSAAAQLTIERVGLVKSQRMQSELVLARAREEVIEVDVVRKQAAFLFVAMRQKLIALPGSIARKLLHQSDIKQIVNILTEAIHKALKELREFPSVVIDPNWKENEDVE